MTAMRTSAAGRKAIAAHEGNRLTAYRCPAGVLTIGVGHTTSAGPPAVTPGMRITAQESDEILANDLATFERVVNNAVKAPLMQNQFDALVSLAFNIGGGAFARSTLVKRLNERDYRGAADQFLVWNKGGGKVLKGLVTRRASERAQFLRIDPEPAPAATPAPPEPVPVVPYREPPPKPADPPQIDTTSPSVWHRILYRIFGL